MVIGYYNVILETSGSTSDSISMTSIQTSAWISFASSALKKGAETLGC
jgi:hypothetical protein